MRHHCCGVILCASSAAADAPWNGLMSCHIVADRSDRVACYDSAIDALLVENQPEKNFVPRRSRRNRTHTDGTSP